MPGARCAPLPDGRIRLAYLSGFAAPPATRRAFCIAESQDGVSFSVVARALWVPGNFTHPSLVELDDGTWLMAISMGQQTVLARSGDGYSFAVSDTVDFGGVPEVAGPSGGRVRMYVCRSGIEAYVSGDRGAAARWRAVSDELAGARERLSGAARVLVFTGAGMSAESGVPTFRGPGGLWKSFRPEDLATPQAFARDPRLVWEWYSWRRELVAGCVPNAAHVALGRWMLRRDGVTLVTQNVDDLHERGALEAARALAAEGRLTAGGGEAARAPIRLHGSLFHSRCTGCGARVHDRDPVDATSPATLPRCAACGRLMRPDVVWFGEALPEDALRSAFAAAERSDVCLVVGTTGAVYPAAAVVEAAEAGGAAVVVVDPGDTGFDGTAAFRVRAPAGTVVPRLLTRGGAAPVGGPPRLGGASLEEGGVT